MPNPQLEPLLQKLLEIHQATFAMGEHEVAYHALAAAAHAAERLQDVATLLKIEQACIEELGWIDAHEPEHKHSSLSAKGRGHHSIFTQLSVTTASMRTRLEMDHRRDEARAK